MCQTFLVYCTILSRVHSTYACSLHAGCITAVCRLHRLACSLHTGVMQPAYADMQPACGRNAACITLACSLHTAVMQPARSRMHTLVCRMYTGVMQAAYARMQPAYVMQARTKQEPNPFATTYFRQKYTLKNTPRMNTFVHGEFYERNAGCMQGVDAAYNRVQPACRLHASVV